MDKLSVQQKSPKEEKAVTHSGGKGKRGKRSKGELNDGQHQKPHMKVVYISNPMRVTTTASEFKDRVQELTGRHADVANIFFNSSSDYNCCSGTGPAASSSANTSGYYSPCSSSSHEEDAVPPESSATVSAIAEPTHPPQAAYNQSELTGHHHLNRWLGGGESDPRNHLPFLGTPTDGRHEAYYSDAFGSQILENHSFPPAANGLQSPPTGQFESPLADLFRRLADGRHP